MDYVKPQKVDVIFVDIKIVILQKTRELIVAQA